MKTAGHGIELARSGRWATTIAAALMAAGCGGGSDDAPATTTAAAVSTEKPVEQPILTMPTSTYTGMYAQAFQRINEARIAAGVSALKQSVELDRAAQAHAEYLAYHNLTGHYQSSLDALFTGTTHVDRALAQKYKNTVTVEVVSTAARDYSGANHVDLHLNSVYHLLGALLPNANEIGIGVSWPSAIGQVSLSITTGTTDSRLMPVKYPIVWPADKAINTARQFVPAIERPNPLPDIATNFSVTVGSPVIYCRRLDLKAPLTVTSAKLVDRLTQAPQAMYVLRHGTASVSGAIRADVLLDPNPADISKQCIFLIPKTPLDVRRTYDVTVTSIEQGVSSETTWAFVTGD